MEYVGTNFCGWQYQKKQITIQGTVEKILKKILKEKVKFCLLYTSPSPRDLAQSRMPSSA